MIWLVGGVMVWRIFPLSTQKGFKSVPARYN